MGNPGAECLGQRPSWDSHGSGGQEKHVLEARLSICLLFVGDSSELRKRIEATRTVSCYWFTERICSALTSYQIDIMRLQCLTLQITYLWTKLMEIWFAFGHLRIWKCQVFYVFRNKYIYRIYNIYDVYLHIKWNMCLYVYIYIYMHVHSDRLQYLLHLKPNPTQLGIWIELVYQSDYNNWWYWCDDIHTAWRNTHIWLQLHCFMCFGMVGIAVWTFQASLA